MFGCVGEKQALSNCRTEVCIALGLPEEQCELSMGMSADFEQAVGSLCSVWNIEMYHIFLRLYMIYSFGIMIQRITISAFLLQFDAKYQI